MDLKPIDNKAQKQSLTTALKNICRDYPAGGTVLKELLQNADDAGATLVRFILDERTHPSDKPIHEHLAQYQGPALLVFNDAEFRPEDFENLSNLGDSQKLRDGSTTGRFGRGFNSVYNWTDSPSIVSRERLLILDPHHAWSPGGNVYDFVENSGHAGMKDHMAAYKKAIENLSERLNGTVIRIPLRTAAQVPKSKIGDRETSISEIREVLESFAHEFRGNGLLFFKNVGKLEFVMEGFEVAIEHMNGEEVQLNKLRVNEAVKCALNDPFYSFDLGFEVGIQYTSSSSTTQVKFMVHHRIDGQCMKTGLQEWATDQKLVPWVAVAAQFPIPSQHNSKGSLFTVLPLPILNSQPIHIHALFSLSPDRARLYQFNDCSAQDQTPAIWNDFLLQRPVSAAWAKLLTNCAIMYPEQSAFDIWPQVLDDDRESLSHALENLLRIIDEESLVIWPTSTGYVSVKDGLLVTSVLPTDLKDALLMAKAPIIYCPTGILHIVEGLFKDRILCPSTLSQFLKTRNGILCQWRDKTKLTILDYLISGDDPVNFTDLKIFPFEDGSFREVGVHNTFVHRNDLEKELFRYDKSRNLDLEKLSEASRVALMLTCQSNHHSNIRFRSSRCLKDYCLETVFKNIPRNKDMVELSADLVSTVSKVWNWISQQGISIFDDDIACLWLLPLSNGYHRKVRARHSSSEVYLAPLGEMGELMWKFDSKVSRKSLPLLKTKPHTGDAQEPLSINMLTKHTNRLSNLSIMNAGSIRVFLQWLHQTSSLDDDVSDNDKFLIAKLVQGSLPPVHDTEERNAVIKVLRQLRIFQRLSWVEVANEMTPVKSWVRLNDCTHSVGLLDEITPVPQIKDTQFLLADSTSASLSLLRNLTLAECLKPVEIIQQYIIPAWERKEVGHWSSDTKIHLATFMLRNFSLLPLPTQKKLQKIPMVPVERLSGGSTHQFSLAADLIDPNFSELKNLCFPDESIVPKKSFLQNFKPALTACGLKNMIDESFLEQRVLYYVRCSYPTSDVMEYAERLLKSTCRWSSPLEKEQNSIIRSMPWIPTVDMNGDLSLRRSSECRGRKDNLLVSSQLPTLRFFVSPEWRTRLGWDSLLPNETLLAQLDFGIKRNERKIIDAVLAYVTRTSLLEELKSRLKGLSCVVANNGILIKPSLAFRPKTSLRHGCDRLHPYLANVEHKFWEAHEKLLVELGVRPEPEIHDLVMIQQILEAKPELDEADLGVAIELSNHATRFSRAAIVDLKVISASGKFEKFQDVNFDDLSPQKPTQEVKLTHPDIPYSTIQRLGIVGLRELMIKDMLSIEDQKDEDEFEQREDVSSNIRDTLGRYPVTATFREYLANADDAVGATKISWLLDSRYHRCDNLLTPEMKELQGPAFLVYNDGVFSQDDFKGFKKIGEGSKAQDTETSGMFGRGSQTMYHWTDSPMILSGGFLIILDPQRRVLPINRFSGVRKPGIKMSLSKLREACPDQLSPFQDLWDYALSMDYYPGTIFRFPLRKAEKHSSLSIQKGVLDGRDVLQLMESYFHEARVSMLFLRRIKSIEFGIHDSPNYGWSVIRLLPSDADANKSFSELVICEFSKNTDLGTPIIGKDKWLVVIEDLDQAIEPAHSSLTRVMKNRECGLAALLSTSLVNQSTETVAPEPLLPKMFNILPLPINSDLPVHVHATFSLSGDRQSITVDEYGQQSHSVTNRYFLETALPKLYLQLLHEVLHELGKTQSQLEVFRYWPQETPPKGSPAESLCNSFWQELPRSSQRVFPKTFLAKEARKRQATEQLTINESVFDFLPKSHSDTLLPLLIALDVKLVRTFPVEVKKRLENIKSIRTVSGRFLRELFRSENSGKCLLEQMRQNSDLYGQLIRKMTPPTSEQSELNGCYVLPLADGTMTALQNIEPNFQPTIYYVTSEKPIELFQFASKLLLDSTVVNTLKPIIESKAFNLEKLQLRHVKKLLELKPKIMIPNRENDKWLNEFWKFWNADPDSFLSTSNLADFDYPIFRATRNGIDRYASPSDLETAPAIISPSGDTHRQMCDSIPDLWIFDPKFMPQTLALKEESLNKDISFFRLIRALGMVRKNVAVSTFVTSHLDPSKRKILRELVSSHLSDGILKNESGKFPGLSEDLKALPLWPSFQNDKTQNTLSASNAFIACDSGLFVPWMKEAHRFLDLDFLNGSRNNSNLLELGAKELSASTILRDHVLPLPSLPGDKWKDFTTLVGTISKVFSAGDIDPSTLALLQEEKIAADGNLTFSRVSKLYDHEDEIFKQAFRLESKSRFLHEDLRVWRPFWIKAGLRHRDNDIINAIDYLECLRVLARRFHLDIDSVLRQDCETVLSPLTSVNTITHRWSTSNWQAVASEKVFLVRTRFTAEAEFRQSGMETVASDHPILSLSEIVSHQYLAICWSQISFPIHRPIEGVLNYMTGKGRPKVDMVWQHLQHMQKLSENLKRDQVKDFLDDLCLTYDYLQEETSGKPITFINDKQAVWLNLDSWDDRKLVLADIKSSWCRIENLVLSSSCDAEHMKAVQPGLMRYEMLLRALGCAFIVYPTVERPASHLGYSLLKSMQKLRDEGRMLDIAYRTEDETIKAHRLVLAAASQKCAAQFSSSLEVEDVITYDEENSPDDFLSYHALSTMIDYAYEKEVNWREMEVSEDDGVDEKEGKLDLLLDLLKGADYWLMHELKSQVQDRILMAGRMFITLENIIKLWERADLSRASDVEKMCTAFISQNRDILEGIHGKERVAKTLQNTS